MSNNLISSEDQRARYDDLHDGNLLQTLRLYIIIEARVIRNNLYELT